MAAAARSWCSSTQLVFSRWAGGRLKYFWKCERTLAWTLALSLHVREKWGSASFQRKAFGTLQGRTSGNREDAKKLRKFQRAETISEKRGDEDRRQKSEEYWREDKIMEKNRDKEESREEAHGAPMRLPAR